MYYVRKSHCPVGDKSLIIETGKLAKQATAP